MTGNTRKIFIDPPSSAYYRNRLFDIDDPVLNRDDTLDPFIRLKSRIAEQGGTVDTADYLFGNDISGETKEYYSLGILENIGKLETRGDVVPRAFVIFEPPVVMPELYKVLPRLTGIFERVYLHNTNGDGYSLKDVDRAKLNKLFWPQPRCDVIEKYWTNSERAKRVVVINGNHKPRTSQAELYSKRIEAMVGLARLGVVDLYGRGWERWWSRESAWLPYWQNRRVLLSIYNGTCASKHEVLSRYTFCLCFENMSMEGYVTEKLFDCLYAGAVPLYLGAKDISSLVTTDAYIDVRNYATWEDLWSTIADLKPAQIQAMRDAGRAFLTSDAGQKYYRSLFQLFSA
jgi:hypothetical protein